MIEEAAGKALNNFNEAGLLGSVLVVFIIIALLGFRFLIKANEELKADLKLERAAHQETRKAQIEDIRNLVHLAGSVDGMRASIESLRDAQIKRSA